MKNEVGEGEVVKKLSKIREKIKWEFDKYW